jgi:hypothetical protein
MRLDADAVLKVLPLSGSHDDYAIAVGSRRGRPIQRAVLTAKCSYRGKLRL